MHRPWLDRRLHLSSIARATIGFRHRRLPSVSKAEVNDRRNPGWANDLVAGHNPARALFDFDATHHRPIGAGHRAEKIHRRKDRAVRARRLRGSQRR